LARYSCASAAFTSAAALPPTRGALARAAKYLNNLIEQDHRAIKPVVRPMLGLKNFRCARAVIAGIVTMHMIKKGQLAAIKDRASSAADKFYSLAF